MPSKQPIYTVGHSKRPLGELIILLHENKVSCLIDIRAYPGSRTNPQFNKQNLESEMPKADIKYLHMPALGGRRNEPKEVTPSPNIFWRNKSFQNYADYALSDAFQEALSELKNIVRKKSCAIMCAEAVWWRCHRRIVADYLLADGFDVIHIMNQGKTTPAKMTDGGRVTNDGLIIYDKKEE
jgi:uncharacterized protein (DUF488 family)